MHDPVKFLEEFQKYIKRIHKLSDRDATIVIASIIDESLTSKLKYRLRDCPVKKNKKDKDKEWYENEHFAFKQKIRLCYAVGLITEGTYKVLMSLAEIRNEFAHKHDITSFTEVNPNKMGEVMKVLDKSLEQYDYIIYMENANPETPRNKELKHEHVHQKVLLEICQVAADIASITQVKPILPIDIEDLYSTPPSPSSGSDDPQP